MEKTIYDEIASKNRTIVKLTAEGESVYNIINTEKVNDTTVYIKGVRYSNPKPEFAFILDDKFIYHTDPNGNIRVYFGDELEYIVI